MRKSGRESKMVNNLGIDRVIVVVSYSEIIFKEDNNYKG